MPTNDILRGIEKQLLKGQREKKISGFLIISTLIVNLLILLFNSHLHIVKSLGDYISNTGEFLVLAFSRDWEKAFDYFELVPEAILFYGLLLLLVYLLFRVLKGHFIKLSEEPFQYTFWVEPFQFTIEESSSKQQIESNTWVNMFKELLHHDLIEKLNERIGRFSLLKIDEKTTNVNFSSHILIRGYISLRAESNSSWIIHIRPWVRIGNIEQPFDLTFPVKQEVNLQDLDQENFQLLPNEYNQALERLYSSVTTEIYKQIDRDLKEKMKLFPNRFLKAVALFNEAEDFTRSNTIDSYDLALRLYEEALKELNMTRRNIFSQKIKLNKYIYPLALPHLLVDTHFHQIKAKINNGYALCKVYKSFVSSFVGQEGDPLYDLPSRLLPSLTSMTLLHNSLFTFKKRIVPINYKEDIWYADENINKNLISLKTKLNRSYISIPRDTIYRRFLFKASEEHLKSQRDILFETLVVFSLVYVLLQANYQANKFMEIAKAMGTELVKKHPICLLSLAELSNTIEEKLHYYSKSILVLGRFEVTQFLFARWKELKFRAENEIKPDRCREIIDHYEEVLRINPGNVSALASQAYMHWLTEDLESAEEKLLQAREVRTIINKTFIAPINYLLARIAVEKGKLNESYNLYKEAIFADPSIAAYTQHYEKKQTLGIFFYDLQGSQIRDRYIAFKEKFENNLLLQQFRFYDQDILDVKEACSSILDLINGNSPFAKKIEQFSYNGTPLTSELEDVLEDEIQETNHVKFGIVQLLNVLLQCITSHNPSEKELKANWKNILSQVHGLRSFHKGHFSTYDSNNEYTSKTVIDRVKGFVYNDYGNAMFNYYNRFGIGEHLEEAITAYKQSIDTYHDNNVAHYNLAIAHQTKGDISSSYEHFEKAKKLDPIWVNPVHDIARRINVGFLGTELKDAMTPNVTTKLESDDTVVGKPKAETNK